MECERCGRSWTPARRKGGVSRFCPDCQPLVSRGSTEVRKWRLSLLDFEDLVDVFGRRLFDERARLMEEQDGCCFVCGREVTKMYLKLIDGTVRGLCRTDRLGGTDGEE